MKEKGKQVPTTPHRTEHQHGCCASLLFSDGSNFSTSAPNRSFLPYWEMTDICHSYALFTDDKNRKITRLVFILTVNVKCLF